MIRINEKINLQNKNIKLMSKATCIVITTSLIGCLLAGCSKTTLEGSKLESTYVASVEGSYELVKAIAPDKCFSIKNKEDATDHRHYQNIITNEILTENEECLKIKYNNEILPTRYVEELKFVDSILDYLDKEEYKKACNDRLTSEDYTNIINKIRSKESPKTFSI